jgi:AcrR family transcriptional regulator
MAEPAIEKPKQKRDAEQTRRTLLTAALKEFAAHGYSGARAERIAKASRRNIRMLYHYFGSKEGIYRAVLENAYFAIREEEARLAIDLDRPLEGLIGLLDFTYAYFAANPEFEALLRAENMMRGKYVSQLPRVAETAFPLRQTLTALIESGQRSGLFRAGLDPCQLYITITALSRFHLANAYSLSALLEIDVASEAWQAERLDHCRALLKAYLLKSG